MALALNILNLFVACVEFQKSSLEFALDIDSSVEATKISNRKRESDDSNFVFLDGSIDFRKNVAAIDLITLIPPQDAGPFQILIPRFLKLIESAESEPLDGLIERGLLSSTLTRLASVVGDARESSESRRAYEHLRKRVVTESHFGRLCYYKVGNECVLEIAIGSSSNEIYVEVVEPKEFFDALEKIQRAFRERVIEVLQGDLPAEPHGE